MSSVLLYSGGMDSWIVDKLYNPDIKLFFNIGTANNKLEFEYVKNRKDIIIIDFPLYQFEQPMNNYFLPLRNLHFINIEFLHILLRLNNYLDYS